VVEPRAETIYLRLPLPRRGLSLGQEELPDLPDSRSRVIREAKLPRTYQFTETLIKQFPTQWVISGQAGASFTVKRRPQETLLHE
jgi:hypothetical protein